MTEALKRGAINEETIQKPLFIEPIENGPDSTMKTLQRLIELLQSNGITVEDDLGGYGQSKNC